MADLFLYSAILHTLDRITPTPFLSSRICMPSHPHLPNLKRNLLCMLISAAMLNGTGCDSVSNQTKPTSDIPPNIFVDRSQELGLDFTHFNGMSGELYMAEIVGSGAALFDYDQDGDLDIYLVQSGLLKNTATPYHDRLFRNDLTQDGQQRFVDITQESGIRATGYGMGIAVGDIDNNGYPDLYVTNYGPNQMWRNNGDGTFDDITQDASTNDIRWSTSAAFVDYDRDGFLDLFVGNYIDFTPAKHKKCYSSFGVEDYCNPLSYAPYSDKLWRNLGNTTFEDVSVRSGITSTYGAALGVVTADFNGDLWPDIYVANDGTANQLWTNNHDGTFSNDALLSGTAFNDMGKPEAGMGVDAADYDGDGDEDLFMTHLKEETNTLYNNDGTGLFEDYTSEAGLGLPSRGFTGFGTAWLDYDNNSWQDLLIANGAVRTIDTLSLAGDPFPFSQTNQLFRNLGQGRFREISSESGSVFSIAEVSRGIAVGDVDNDGDTDALLINNNGPARLLINQVGQDNIWLGLRLLGKTDKRDQYGAQVACKLSGGRILWRRVRAAASYCSSNDPRVLFGLGQTKNIDSIEVIWPDGTSEVWNGDDFALGQYHTIVQGSGRAQL